MPKSVLKTAPQTKSSKEKGQSASPSFLNRHLWLTLHTGIFMDTYTLIPSGCHYQMARSKSFRVFSLPRVMYVYGRVDLQKSNLCKDILVMN